MIKPVSAADFQKAMQEAYREKSGFIPQEASDLGLRISVLATELESLADSIRQAGENAFPQTAAGKALDLLAGARGLSRRPAQSAGGSLRFFRSTPAAENIIIPDGTLCAGVGGLRFRTTGQAVLARGESEILVPASAAEPGQSGNVPALSVKVMISSVAGVSSVSNPAPFAGGLDEEDDKCLRARLLSHMADPPSSFNAAFYRQSALAFSGVRSVQVLPMNRGVGTVDVIIAALPGHDPAIVAENLGLVFSQAREVGADVKVSPAQMRGVEVVCMVRAVRGHSASGVVGDAQRALAELIASLQVGQGLPLSRISAALMGVAGVENMRIISPGADIPSQPGGLITAAEIEVVEASVGMPEVSAR